MAVNKDNRNLKTPVANPIVLVPGFMASSMWTRPTFALIPPVLAWPLNAYSITAQLFLLRSNNPLEADGLVKGYYDELIHFICRSPAENGLGCDEGQTFWVFPYDWRQSCRENGYKLAQFIHDKLERANSQRLSLGLSPYRQVDIINHSMGGIITRAALRLYNAPVQRVVYIGSPHYGSTKAYFALHPDTVGGIIDEFVKDFLPGWYWDLLKALPNVFLVQEWLIRLIAGFPAIYELLPDEFYLDDTSYLLLDNSRELNRPILGVEETYFRNPWQMPPVRQAKIRQALEFKAALGADLPGEQNLVIFAGSLPTYTFASYHNHRLEHPQKVSNGDFTVTSNSARPVKATEQVQIDVPHSKLPTSEEVHQAILQFYKRAELPLARKMRKSKVADLRELDKVST